MPKMFDRVFRENLLEAERLVAAGVSIRAAAKQTGVSRSAISRRLAAAALGEARRREARGPVVIDAETGQERPAVRCPGCGGLVVMPCRACELRAIASL